MVRRIILAATLLVILATTAHAQAGINSPTLNRTWGPVKALYR